MEREARKEMRVGSVEKHTKGGGGVRTGRRWKVKKTREKIKHELLSITGQ